MNVKSMKRRLGPEGEEIARRYLVGRGMEIVEMNYRFDRAEVDIIAREGETLVFCEVKTRDNDEFGPPEYAVTTRKQRQIRKAAEGYLYDHEIKEQECRFDVVAIRLVKGAPEINHIRNAFT